MYKPALVPERLCRGTNCNQYRCVLVPELLACHFTTSCSESYGSIVATMGLPVFHVTEHAIQLSNIYGADCNFALIHGSRIHIHVWAGASLLRLGDDCSTYYGATDAHALDWIGLDWIGLDWIGLDWIGLDWIGLVGLDWIGCSSWYYR
jgi:hypothetical protein